MVKPENLQYAEASQLTYTLTRPDVYNAILAIPGYSMELERELGVDKSRGMDSYDYMVTYEAITVDSRFMWRAKSRDGYYWKTFDILTQGESDFERWNIDQAYKIGDVTYPFWSHPIPKFIKNQGGTTPEDLRRELYPPSSKLRPKMEADRRLFLSAMAEVKQGMVLGVDKNIYVEPAIWTIEWARDFYKYPVTRSN